MTQECEQCGEALTLEKQKSGTQHTTDDKPNGAFYTVRCRNCSHKNPEAVKRLIQND